MRLQIFVFYIFITTITFGSSSLIPVDPDEHRTIPELIESRGFQHEDHHVITEDGYILGLFRIVNPYARNSLKPLKPIIFHHSLLFSGSCFLFNSPRENIVPWVNGTVPKVTGNSLGFLLANLGYDVWLANARGNSYSRNHTHLNPDLDSKFWDFSFDEMIDYDAPALVDYVLHVSKQETLGWIGFSQGAMMMFGLLAEKPEYSAKIKPFISLGPAVYLGNVQTLLAKVADIPGLFTLGRHVKAEFLNPGLAFNTINLLLCHLPITRIVCSNVLYLTTGRDSEQLNKTRESVYIGQVSGTSWTNMLHYFQNIKSNRFSRFDYGRKENERIYGTPTPPNFGLHKINSSYIAIINAENDLLSDPEDVEKLKESLTVPLLKEHLVEFKQWNHLDFVYALESYKYVNSIVLEILGQAFS